MHELKISKLKIGMAIFWYNLNIKELWSLHYASVKITSTI